MSVKLEIPSIFRRYTDEKTTLELPGNTIGEVLENFKKRYPRVKKVFFDKEGKLLHSFDIYINGQSIYPLKMEHPVKDGDKLDLVMIISGG